jgi:hypothetical protein
MIDYDKIDDDPIVAEVRRAREEYAARYNYDLRAIFEDLQRHQATNGQKYISLPPRRPETQGIAATKTG